MTAAMCSNQQQKEGSGSPRPSPPITTVHVIYVRIIGDTLKINRFLFLFFFLQFFSSEAYISTSHLGNQSSGDENCRAKHHKIVLKPKKDGLGCIISHKHIVLMIY